MVQRTPKFLIFMAYKRMKENIKSIKKCLIGVRFIVWIVIRIWSYDPDCVLGMASSTWSVRIARNLSGPFRIVWSYNIVLKKTTPSQCLHSFFGVPKCCAYFLFCQFILTKLSLISTQTFQNTSTFLSKHVTPFIVLHHSKEHLLPFDFI